MNELYAPTEEGLRKGLMDINEFPGATVPSILAALPPEEATALLAQIAQDADRDRPTLWSYILAFFLVVIFLGLVADLPGGRGPAKRQAGIRAALHLARRGDLRAFVPLARSWDPRPLSKSEHQEQIEHSLIQMLSRLPTDRSVPLPSAPLAELAERVWRSKRRWSDLTSGQSDLLQALVRQLASRPGEAQETLQMLRAGGSGVNRARVSEAARLV